jgi:DNA-binding NarL/FixJ family response regulator
VLVVDDHEVVRQGIRKMLEQADGVRVVGEAADGVAAIDQIQALTPDVVLLDLEMPRLNGVETLAKLRELGVEAGVILLSTYAKDEYVVEGLRRGARGYLLKDASREDLLGAIRTVHGGGSLLQPVVATRLLERLEAGAASDLTERELDVLRLLATGARSKEIAAQLHVEVRTVRFHTENIFRKLDATTRTQAVRIAAERGLLPL